MLTAYSRVTVVTAERKVDLALPTALPVADVVPQILRYCAPPDGSDRPTAWTLARVGGQPLSLSQTLSDAGVLDGDVIELRPQRDEVRPAMVEDIRDAVEDSVDAAGGAWSPTTTRMASLLAGSVLLLAVAAVRYARPELVGIDRSGRLVSAVGAVLVLLGLSAWARVFSTGWVAQAAIAVAMVWGYLLGGTIGDVADLDRAVTVMTSMAIVALVAGAGRAITAAGTALAAVAVVLLVAAVAVGVTELYDVDPDQAYRVLPVAALLSTGVMPRLSLSVGGLASADYRVRHVGRMRLEALRWRYQQSNAMLVGTLVGLALVIGWAAAHLTFGTNDWDRYLAIGLGLGALLRSRVYSRTVHMVALRAVAVAILALQLARLGEDVPGVRAGSTAIVCGAVLLVVAVSTLPMSVITRARVKRVLNLVEFFVIVDVVVLMFGATGVIAALGGLV